METHPAKRIQSRPRQVETSETRRVTSVNHPAGSIQAGRQATVCVFSKSKQTSQAGRTNQHTKQRKEGKKERVGSLPSNQQTKCCRYFLCIGSPPSNQQTKQPKPHNPVFSQMLSILGLHCGEGAAPCPAPPPAFIYTASIHPSSKHTNRKNAYPSSTVSHKQSTASKPSNHRTKKLHLSPCP